ncbi:hypothetical protein HanIR_Chr13g0651671 [Helianthus annuus]|nr:hypothetical protein HanIR_Chr13g0651671 [Helianthus annuus]
MKMMRVIILQQTTEQKIDIVMLMLLNIYIYDFCLYQQPKWTLSLYATNIICLDIKVYLVNFSTSHRRAFL